MDCSLLGPSVHGISQARILEWLTIFFSRGSSRVGDWTCVFCIGMWILYHWATLEAPKLFHTSVKNQLAVFCIWFCFWSLFHLYLYAFSSVSTMLSWLLLYSHIISCKIRWCDSCNFILLQNCFTYYGIFTFPYRTVLTISTKYFEILVVNILNQ